MVGIYHVALAVAEGLVDDSDLSFVPLVDFAEVFELPLEEAVVGAVPLMFKHRHIDVLLCVNPPAINMHVGVPYGLEGLDLQATLSRREWQLEG